MTTENESDASKSIARVSIKVPSFWKPDPKIWFLQLEAQFRNAAITTDQTKYDYVISSIEAEILAQVSDILTNPPKDNKYSAIKDRLISIFAETETQKTQKLLTEVELGDRKPSQLLCEMKNLASDKVSEAFLKTLWLQRLPTAISSILSISGDDLAKLATMADKMWEIKSTSLQNSAVTCSGEDNVLVKLQEQISELSLQLAELNKRNYSRQQQSRSRSRNVSINRRGSVDESICYYHSKFGDRAFKCSNPCNWPNKSNVHRQEN